MRSISCCGVLLMFALAGSSCSENNPPPPAKPKTILSPPVSTNSADGAAQKKSERATSETRDKSARNRAPLAAAAASDASDIPVPPKGAQYTIFCGRVDGEAHVERANKLKGDLIAKTRMNGWYIIHDQSQSLLYYGFYRAFNDAKDPNESARAQNDRKRIESLTDEMQNRIFTNALFVDIESPDPVAPREWNLTNANGFWTLQIAAYKDSPHRKEAAVDAVREARAQGIEAYFYHGDTISSVCIGAWPEEAVRYQSPNRTGKLIIDPMVVNQPVIVSGSDPAQQLPAKEMFADAEKHNLKVVQGKVEILDVALVAAMRQYPYHAVNGMTMVKRVEGKEIPDPSILVKIPRESQDTAMTPRAAPRMLTNEPPWDAEPAKSNQPPPPRKDPPPSTPGLGKLKSVGG